MFSACTWDGVIVIGGGGVIVEGCSLAVSISSLLFSLGGVFTIGGRGVIMIHGCTLGASISSLLVSKGSVFIIGGGGVMVI